MITFKEYFVLFERKDIERNISVNKALDKFYKDLVEHYNTEFENIFINRDELEDWFEWYDDLPPIEINGNIVSVNIDRSCDNAGARCQYVDNGMNIILHDTVLYSLVEALVILVEEFRFPEQPITEEDANNITQQAKGIIEQILKNLKDPYWRSVLFHELIHALEYDYKSRDVYDTTSSLEDKKNTKKSNRILRTNSGHIQEFKNKTYFNLEAEVNAFYQEILNKVLQIPNISNYSFEEFKKLFMFEILEYSKDQDFDMWSKLSRKNKKRMLKRLSDAWINLK